VAIIEYLNDVYPDPPLLPAEPYLRARARMLAEIVNAGIQPMQNASLMRRLEQRGVDADELARDHIARGLAALENACQPTAQGYLVGESISTADIFLIPQLYVARRFHLDLSATPTLLSVEDRCAEHPAFVRAHADAQPGAPS
jgi:maleylpyruvate isomerase